MNDGEAPRPLGESAGDAVQDEAGDPGHDSATPAFDHDEDDPDVVLRGEHAPAFDLADD